MELYGTLENDIIEKLYSFCAYQERCEQDVVKKLYKLEIDSKFHNKYLQHLIDERFLSEDRFAKFFVKGKLKGNKWGKRKIEFALKQKGVKHTIIKEYLDGIKTEEYHEVAMQVAQKKNRGLREPDYWKRKQKIYAYLAQKGFESQVIQNTIDDLNLEKQ